MNRPALLLISPTFLFLIASASCVVRETPPPNNPPPAGTVAGTPPPAGTTTAPPPSGTTPPPTGPTGTATTPPPTTGTPPTFPAGTPPSLPPTLAIPGVCIPIGSWSKQFDNGIPASGTVDIGTPIVFNQFPVNDGVVIATMPAGSLKGIGAMTSTNDLSVDVTNGGYTISYTCKFAGSNCNQGTCTTTKGGLGGFKLNKK